MWFKELMGFVEDGPENVRTNISIEEDRLISKINQKSYQFGRLEIPSLGELRKRLPSLNSFTSSISLEEQVGDVQQLHLDPSNAGSIFQAASQFNLLEMVGPQITPEHGLDIYENDRTQGPACAIAAGAGTIYRNYFVSLNNQIGQSIGNQIDCLEDLGLILGNQDQKLWEMKNGYALASEEGLMHIDQILEKKNEDEYDELMGHLRVGMQWNTQVTLNNCKHTVHQAYCSALPLAYSNQPAHLWKGFAQLILKASYETTLCLGLLNFLNSGNKKVYLTLLGGGAFGNPTSWIIDAIEQSLEKFRRTPLEVTVVSYGRSNSSIKNLCHLF